MNPRHEDKRTIDDIRAGLTQRYGTKPDEVEPDWKPMLFVFGLCALAVLATIGFLLYDLGVL